MIDALWEYSKMRISLVWSSVMNALPDSREITLENVFLMVALELLTNALSVDLMKSHKQPSILVQSPIRYAFQIVASQLGLVSLLPHQLQDHHYAWYVDKDSTALNRAHLKHA